MSKCKVGQSDDLVENDHVPVTSFIRTGNFGEYGTVLFCWFFLQPFRYLLIFLSN